VRVEINDQRLVKSIEGSAAEDRISKIDCAGDWLTLNIPKLKQK
jgi:hypothetical protein